jgi:hypothetical protein
MPLTLVPLRHLTGVRVWQGNVLLGSIWFDRWGWRWHAPFVPGERFRFGVCNSFDEALDRLI